MLTKTYTLSCDHEGCTTPPVVVTTEARPVDGPGRVRHEAFEAGWRRMSFGNDYCPAHVAEHSVQVTIDAVSEAEPAGYRGVPMSLGTNGPVRVETGGALARARAAQREAGS